MVGEGSDAVRVVRSAVCESLAEGRFGFGGSATFCTPQDLACWCDEHQDDCTHRRDLEVFEELSSVDVQGDGRVTDLWIRDAASHASVDEPGDGSVRL